MKNDESRDVKNTFTVIGTKRRSAPSRCCALRKMDCLRVRSAHQPTGLLGRIWKTSVDF